MNLFRAASKPPLLSVVMPVHNTSRFLVSSIESILRQSFLDFEFIIVDDFSSDGSLEIISEYAQKDPRIKVIQNEKHLGAQRTRNIGCSHVQAKYIAVFDSDDIARESRFEAQLKYLSEHPELILLGTFASIIDPFGNPIAENITLPCSHEEIDNQLILGGWPIIHPSVIMQTDAFNKVGGYTEGWGSQHDHDLFLRLAEIGRLENLPENHLYYRIHLNNMSFKHLKHKAKFPGCKFQGIKPAIEAAAIRRKIMLPSREEINAKKRNNVKPKNLKYLQLKWALREFSLGIKGSSLQVLLGIVFLMREYASATKKFLKSKTKGSKI
ncbi:MAG: glycosyltransferase [Candidatus Obscuribacterales bacterium]|nr:glycosyltransferase [Candidatus Obscuribacterales bacterium]